MKAAVVSILGLGLVLVGMLEANGSVGHVTPSCISMCHSYNKRSSKHLCLLLMCRKAILGYFNRFGKRGGDVGGGARLGGLLSGRIHEEETGQLVQSQPESSGVSDAKQDVHSQPQHGLSLPSVQIDELARPDEEFDLESHNQTKEVNAAAQIPTEKAADKTSLPAPSDGLHNSVQNSNTLFENRKPDQIPLPGFIDQSSARKAEAQTQDNGYKRQTLLQNLNHPRKIKNKFHETDSPRSTFYVFAHDKDKPSVDKRQLRSRAEADVANSLSSLFSSRVIFLPLQLGHVASPPTAAAAAVLMGVSKEQSNSRAEHNQVSARESKNETGPVLNEVWPSEKLLSEDDHLAVEDKVSMTSQLPSELGQDQSLLPEWTHDISSPLLVLADNHTQLTLLPLTGRAGNGSDVTGTALSGNRLSDMRAIVGMVQKLAGGQPYRQKRRHSNYN